MADYDAWNSGVIAYFVERTVLGAPVFLAVNDDALARVGHQLAQSNGRLETEATSAELVKDFSLAVRSRVVTPRGRIDLRSVQGTDTSEQPYCGAFLCALVLAASRMRESDAMDDVNYFGRLREVLALPAGIGRPDGMRSGAESEEPLWKLWNFWLQVRGRLPSALQGQEGPQRFIHYASSQAMLRGVDQDKLVELFRVKGWQSDLDEATLMLRVRREAPYLTAHMRELFGSDSYRQQAVASAIHELYEEWRTDPGGWGTHVRGRTPYLYAGLYREQDPLSGSVSYHLYPHAPRSLAPEELCVQLPDGTHPLRPDRPGWCLPLQPVDAKALASGARYPVLPQGEIDALILPERAFWLLVSDPENPDSGVLASWGPPRLGDPFVLLCRADVMPQVQEVRQENLIESQDPIPVLGGSWVELRDCRVMSEAWSASYFGSSDLYEALRPADKCNVTVSGGLRLPGGAGWLDQYGPRVAVFGFDDEAQVTIIDAQTERPVMERVQRSGEPIAVTWPGPGSYRILGVCGGQEARRLVVIVPWDSLHLADDVQRQVMTIGGSDICGAALA